MGVRGPAPKPTALKVLQGNPGKRAIPKHEPKPPPLAPPCPDFLDAAAKVEWRRSVKLLLALGLVTQLDQAALAAYCQLYSRWQACEAVIGAAGMTYELERVDKSGNSLGLFVGVRPEVTIARQCLQLMRAYATEFGLTPSARGRLTVPENHRAGEIDDLLD